MTRALHFLTHAQVIQDPHAPVPDWGLSDLGRARHEAFASSSVLDHVTALYASRERKAREAAVPVSEHLGLPVRIVPALGENDRSATGYLPPAEFEATADAFFAQPDTSVRGWETARAAQARIVAAVGTVAALDGTVGDVLIVAHGAVGALLRCHLKGLDITRAEDQPAGGGNLFSTDLDLTQAPSDWRSI